ncbi:MAG: AraC family transcriptional regulator [Proteobacteria bacterium]|nr:AraC family transcriptional regulator [Pseudomonadota bacterium]
MPQKSTTVGVVTIPGNIPGLYAQKVLDVVSRHGGDISGFWQQSRLLRQLPENSLLAEVELTYDEYQEFVEDILDRFEISGLGLRIGRRFRASDFGILGYAMLSARNLEFALRLAERYQLLWGGGTRLTTRFYIGEKHAIWEESSRLPPGQLQRFQLEEATAQFLTTKELLAEPDKLRLTKVEFAFPAPEYLAMFEETFHCPVEFNRPHTRITFPKSILDAELGAANELAQGICEEQCRKLLRVLENRGGLTEKIRIIILNSPGRVPPLQDVANELNMSVRTVRRKLKAEGTNYKEIFTDIRMKVAKQYLLETGLSIKEIGYLLSYSEVANFQRAFKNWYATTPNEMRTAYLGRH